jgi:hypothetical protein
MHENGLIRDFEGEIPTPEDCRLGKPNAIGWWSPIENGPMFTGLYLPAACERARRSGSADNIAHVRKMVDGLLLAASVSDVPGFIARGMGTDGRCHYPMGSGDQTHPWFYGLHAYLTSGLATTEERDRIIAKMVEVAKALVDCDWQCPCDGAFSGEFRGDFRKPLHRDVACYLFLLRAMYDLTEDGAWLERFIEALRECPAGRNISRLEICATGYAPDREAIKNIDTCQLWIYVGTQGSLAQLLAMDPDTSRQPYYRAGLEANAANALAVIEGGTPFDNNDTKVFGHADWRRGYPNWFPQHTQQDAEKAAFSGDKEALGERKSYEARYMRNYLAGAAIVALGGDGATREMVEQTIRHYDYDKLHMAELFYAECAYYALPCSS